MVLSISVSEHVRLVPKGREFTGVVPRVGRLNPTTRTMEPRVHQNHIQNPSSWKHDWASSSQFSATATSKNTFPVVLHKSKAWSDPEYPPGKEFWSWATRMAGERTSIVALSSPCLDKPSYAATMDHPKETLVAHWGHQWTQSQSSFGGTQLQPPMILDLQHD